MSRSLDMSRAVGKIGREKYVLKAYVTRRSHGKISAGLYRRSGLSLSLSIALSLYPRDYGIGRSGSSPPPPPPPVHPVTLHEI